MGIDERKKKESFGFFIRHRLDSGDKDLVEIYKSISCSSISFKFNSDENGSWNAKYMMIYYYSRRFRYNAT